MEVKLGWRQTGKVGVLYESSRLGTVIVFDEMRQSAVSESKWNTFTLHVLLTHTRNNLTEKKIIIR